VGDEARLWAAYEACNLERFGVRLPLAEGTDAGGPDRLRAQIQHLLWTLPPSSSTAACSWRRSTPTWRAWPDGAAEPFGRDERARGPGPEGSEVRRVLAGPSEACVDVERRLVWLGTHSYAFRATWARSMNERGQGRAPRSAWDDFLCQEATPWSGLGAVELLAAALDLSPADRESLLAWRLRHTSAYRVLAVEAGRLRLENVAGEREYPVGLELEAAAEAARGAVLAVLRKRFGDAPAGLAAAVEAVGDVDALRWLLEEAVVVGSVADFERLVGEVAPSS